MSEYWKSTPKYWCKHCSTYVKDTPFERKQHENTAKHQNSLKRFLRDIQNSHERGEREKERAKSEVERLTRVAGGDTTQPSSTTAHPSSKPAPPTVRRNATGPQTVADQKRQWAQLAEMGIKVPEQLRSEMALAGDWQEVSQRRVDQPASEAPLSVGVQKRKYEGEGEEEETDEAIVRRGWGATTKQYPAQYKADLEDLLSGSVSLRKGKLSSTTSQSQKAPVKKEGDSPFSREPVESERYPPEQVEIRRDGKESEDHTFVKEEQVPAHESHPVVKIPEVASAPMFKKRKAKAS